MTLTDGGISWPVSLQHILLEAVKCKTDLLAASKLATDSDDMIAVSSSVCMLSLNVVFIVLIFTSSCADVQQQRVQLVWYMSHIYCTYPSRSYHRYENHHIFQLGQVFPTVDI